MRELISETPSLFPEPSQKLARDFVRWCCSFGGEFRNSPDVTNLRFWAQKNKLKLRNNKEENEVLIEARPLFSKQIDKLMRKADKADPVN